MIRGQQVITVGLLLVMGVALVSGMAVGGPPDEPRNGVNETRFHFLWSEDEDEGLNLTEGLAAEQIGNGTDVPFAEPPVIVDRWNRNETGRFPGEAAGDTSQSVVPAGADTRDGSRQWVQDAHVTQTAIMPSTQVYENASETTLYVPHTGAIGGVIDFWVDKPEDKRQGDRRVIYKNGQHSIESSRVVADIVPASGLAPERYELAQAPKKSSFVTNFSYNNSPRVPLKTHRLGLEATISASFVKDVDVYECDSDGDDCEWEDVYEERLYDTVTVEDMRSVRRYDITATTTGFQAEYPNGDLGVVVSQTEMPYLGLSFSDKELVYGSWQFFSSRQDGWETMTVKGQSGKKTQNSTVWPLQLQAYPGREKPQAVAKDNKLGSVETLDIAGTERQRPTLPPKVTLEPVGNQTYNETTQIAARHPTATVDQLRVMGIVRGEQIPVAEKLDPIDIKQTRVRGETTTMENGSVRVDVSLSTVNGTPIKTGDGYLTIDGVIAETNSEGKASVYMSNPGGPYRVRYVPGGFWNGGVGYTEASTYVTTEINFGALAKVAVALGSVLLIGWIPLWFFDRMLGTNLWPPWRGYFK